MALAIWNPRMVLGLRADDQTEWRCVGTNNPSADSGPHQTPLRCDRPIQPKELGKIKGLLAAMSQQMPDQIDHNELLHLARACLCPDLPKPHRGAQEAAVIYRWTELMSAEASDLRASLNPRTITHADLGLPPSPRAQSFEAAVPSSPPLYAPKPKPGRIAPLQAAQPRLVTNLKSNKKDLGGDVFFPTPVAMDRLSPIKLMERKAEMDNNEKWETETVIPSPLSSMPFCFSPTTARDIENSRNANNLPPSTSSLSGHLSGSSSAYSTPATTPGLRLTTARTPTSLPTHTSLSPTAAAAAVAAQEFPPSPPLSAVSPQAPVSLHNTHLLSPNGPGSGPSTLELSPGDRIITTSLVIPAHSANNSPFYGCGYGYQLVGPPPTSPPPLDRQRKQEECCCSGRLLQESRADNRILTDQISALRAELADLRRGQAGMALLTWLVQVVSCFPVVMVGWIEALVEGWVSVVSGTVTGFEKRQLRSGKRPAGQAGEEEEGNTAGSKDTGSSLEDSCVSTIGVVEEGGRSKVD